jgi:hypothetical protein
MKKFYWVPWAISKVNVSVGMKSDMVRANY